MWLVSLLSLVFLIAEAVVVTIFLMIALNGFTSLPDAMGIIYLVFAGLLLPVLAVVIGFLAKRITERRSMPLWVAGVGTTAVSMVIMPCLLCGLTALLLVAFGMI